MRSAVRFERGRSGSWSDGYLVDVRDVQRRVDQPFVHGVFSVFAFLVQVHGLQTGPTCF